MTATTTPPTVAAFVAEILRLHDDGDINAYGVYRQAIQDDGRDTAAVFIRRAAELDHIACLQGTGIFQDEFNSLMHGPPITPTPMTVPFAITRLQQALVSAGSRAEALRLVVKVHRPGAIGGTPCAPVIGVHVGFDWDAGKCFLQLDTELTALTAQEKADIETSVRQGSSWHAYQVNKGLRDQVERLTRERDELAKQVQGLRHSNTQS